MRNVLSGYTPWMNGSYMYVYFSSISFRKLRTMSPGFEIVTVSFFPVRFVFFSFTKDGVLQVSMVALLSRKQHQKSTKVRRKLRKKRTIGARYWWKRRSN